MNILSELCDQGTLFDLLQKYQGKLSEDQIIFILKDVARGLQRMHECQPKGYAHRDIKIENVLLNNKKFKLCDFGSASSSTLDFEKEGALLTSH